MDNLIPKEQTGGWDSDTDLQRVRPNDWIDAHNLTNTKKGSNERVDLELIGGNEYKFSLGSVSTQAKVFSFLITEAQEPQNLIVSNPVTGVQVFTQNGIPILSSPLTVVNGVSYTVANYASQIETALVAAGSTTATAVAAIIFTTDIALSN